MLGVSGSAAEGPRFEAYTAFAVEATDPRVVQWLGPDALRASLRASLVEEYRQRTQPENLAVYRSRCPVPGASPASYALREIDLGSVGSVIAGIHFEGMEVARPFVGVAARTCAVRSRREAEAIGRRLRSEFALFAPSRWWLGSSALDTGLEEAGAVVDQHLVVGRLGSLRARPTPKPDLDVALRATPVEPVYPLYRAMYERLFATSPHMRGVVQVEEPGTLQSAADLGAFFRVDVEGVLAGFLAAVPSREAPIDGWVVLEEILDGPYRGRGLAAPIQRMFIDALPAPDDAFLFGHIAAVNPRSLRTALRAGRVEIGRWCFLPFPA